MFLLGVAFFTKVFLGFLRSFFLGVGVFFRFF